MVAARFEFRFDPAYRVAALPFAVMPRTAYVIVDETSLKARFGPWKLHTARENVTDAQLSGGYAFAKTAGPAHLSFSDRGVTFATNGDQGVCLTFREPVQVLDPTGRLRHPGATFTVADCPGFAALFT